MSSKWKPSYESGRKHNRQREAKYTWASKAPGDSESVFCKVCKCTVAPKASALETHEATKKHKNKVPAPSFQQLEVTKKPSITEEKDSVKKAELQLAVRVACHCAIRSIDHL